MLWVLEWNGKPTNGVFYCGNWIVEVRPKTPEDLVQKLLTDSAVQEQLVMNMDLSVEAQATLSDLLLESRVLRVGTEEARVIGFLLFAAWQRTVVGSFGHCLNNYDNLYGAVSWPYRYNHQCASCLPVHQLSTLACLLTGMCVCVIVGYCFISTDAMMKLLP